MRARQTIGWLKGFCAAAMFTPAALAEDAHYVTASGLNARLCPDTACPAADTLPHGARVTVYERKDGWARVSAWYPAAGEREKFPDIEGERVARWVSAEFLSTTKPKPRTASGPNDPRIIYMPRAGQHGLTAEDVRILRSYAVKVLKSGACTSVTNADKTRDGRYFVTCGNEYQSRYFRKSDAQ